MGKNARKGKKNGRKGARKARKGKSRKGKKGSKRAGKKGKKASKKGKKGKKKGRKAGKKTKKGKKRAKKGNKKSRKMKKKSRKMKKKSRKSRKQKKKSRKAKKKSRKGKKNSRKQKRKQTKGKRKNGRKSQARQNKCMNESCINTAMSYMKIMKDKVSNFLRQKTRVSKYSTTSGNKAGKKGLFGPILNRIREAGGGNSSNLKCNGDNAGAGAKQLANLTSLLGACEEDIHTACSESHPSINQTEHDLCEAEMASFAALTN